MLEDDESRLIEEIRAGSDTAFREVLDHHGPSISNYVRRMINRHVDAEDIVQDTFLRFWSTRDRYDASRSKLTTWLHRIAHNLCIDSIRRRHFDDAAENDLEDTRRGPAEAYALTEQADRVQRALSELSERQRSAIVLCHYQQFSNKQAAKILDLSVDALESLLRRGREKLKQFLSETIDEP